MEGAEDPAFLDEDFEAFEEMDDDDFMAGLEQTMKVAEERQKNEVDYTVAVGVLSSMLVVVMVSLWIYSVTKQV